MCAPVGGRGYERRPLQEIGISAAARAQERRINVLTAALQHKDDELHKARVLRPPPLNAKNVNDVAASQHRFQRMNTFASPLQGLQQECLNADDWTQDVFVQKLWCFLHIKVATKKSIKPTKPRSQATPASGSHGSGEVVPPNAAPHTATLAAPSPGQPMPRPGSCFK